MIYVDVVIPDVAVDILPGTLFSDVTRLTISTIVDHLEDFRFTGNLVRSIGVIDNSINYSTFSGILRIGPNPALGPASQGRPLSIYVPAIERGTGPVRLDRAGITRVIQWAIARGISRPFGVVRKIRNYGITAKNREPAIDADLRDRLQSFFSQFRLEVRFR